MFRPSADRVLQNDLGCVYSCVQCRQSACISAAPALSTVTPSSPSPRGMARCQPCHRHLDRHLIATQPTATQARKRLVSRSSHGGRRGSSLASQHGWRGGSSNPCSDIGPACAVPGHSGGCKPLSREHCSVPCPSDGASLLWLAPDRFTQNPRRAPRADVSLLVSSTACVF